MGRLIDTDANRDEFMEKVYDILSDEPDNIKANLIIDAFDEMPTAYDPDKVVEQLEDEVEEYGKRIERRNGDCYFDETEKIKALEERARGIEKAIEIVKGGGVDGN